jgi:ArsR family transcriptional regulator, arsenate/arsenite/antimonite-responsive transcriptional repressor
VGGQAQGAREAIDDGCRVTCSGTCREARKPVLLEVALAIALDELDELGCGVHAASDCGIERCRCADLATGIEKCQYADGMKRITDPDALLLQGAADPTRLAILRQLAAGEGVCACDFTSCCDVAQPTVSHHLKVLREAGWVRSERQGSNVWYWLRPEAVDRCREIAGELAPVLGASGARALPVVQPSA